MPQQDMSAGHLDSIARQLERVAGEMERSREHREYEMAGARALAAVLRSDVTDETMPAEVVAESQQLLDVLMVQFPWLELERQAERAQEAADADAPADPDASVQTT